MSAADRLLAGLLSFAVVVALASFPIAAALDADRVSEGRAVTPGFGFLSKWSALWAVPADRSPQDLCLLYLGRDGSLGAFWDAEHQRTVLLDVSGTVIHGSERPASSVCRWTGQPE